MTRTSFLLSLVSQILLLHYEWTLCHVSIPYGYWEKMCPDRDAVMMTINVPWGVPGRAYLTLPPGLAIMPSTIPGAGFGILATTFIKKYTWLGESEGEFVNKKSAISEYAWAIKRNGVLIAYVDPYHLDRSSYHRFLNCPTRQIDENVQHLACYGKIFFMTMKDIIPGDELLIYYGPKYAISRLKFDLNNYYDVAKFWRNRGLDLNKFSHRQKVRTAQLELHDTCQSCPRHKGLMTLDLK